MVHGDSIYISSISYMMFGFKFLASSGCSGTVCEETQGMSGSLTTDGKAGVEADDPRGGNFCSQAYLYMVPGTFILLTVLILAFLQLSTKSVS